MRILLQSEFGASRKEPLAEMFDRVIAGFEQAGMGSPAVQFALSDAPLPGHVSSVDRVLNRFPQMRRFLDEASPLPPMPSGRRLTSRQTPGEGLDTATLRAILAGVPKSFPFHGVMIAFAAPALGEGSFQTLLGEVTSGITLADSWWVTGRSRSLSAFVFVEAESAAKKLPPLPDAAARLYAALGKAKRTVQIPLPAANPQIAQAAKAETLVAVGAVTSNFRARMPEFLDQLAFPHDLPPMLEAMKVTPLGEKAGPLKPALVKAFKPMGYDCKSESGTLTLRRKTAANSTLEISLDAGTWSRSLTAIFILHGLGFRTSLRLAVSKRAGLGQYPIGGADRWQQIVENLQVLIAELERTFVAEVEAAAGPSPEWYTPETF